MMESNRERCRGAPSLDYLPVNFTSYNHSDEELRERAEAELHETTENKERCLEELNLWLDSQNKFKGYPDTDMKIKFLRHAKYNVTKAKKRLTNYYSLPTKYPKWFSADPTDPDLLKYAKVLFPLPGRDEKGRGLIMFRPPMFNTLKGDDVNMFCTYLFMSMDLGLLFPEIQVNGGVMLVDHAGFSVSHAATWARPNMLRKLFRVWLDCYPIRVKALHHFNQSIFFDALFGTVKPFLSEKMVKRFLVHDTVESMCDHHVDRRLLPAEYGGEAGTVAELQDAVKLVFHKEREFLMTRFC